MLKLFILGIILSAGIWLGACYTGRKGLQKDYDQEYHDLVRTVNGFAITKHNYAVIGNRFTKIHRFRCRDKERLSVLKGEFERRFAEVVDKTETL